MSPVTKNNLTVIALGANLRSQLGGRKATIIASIAALARRDLRAVSTSRLFSTPAFPSGNGADFVNAVVVVRTENESLWILEQLHKVEAEFGRTRERRWGQRVLDLDLIANRGEVLPDVATFAAWRDLPLQQQSQETPQTLILPHPRLQDRAFVLGPMMDVAPDWVHPVSGRTCREMWLALPAAQRAEITPIGHV